MQKDPNGKSSSEPGAKLDAGKSPVYQGVINYFPNAIKAVAGLSKKGADKYSWKGWEDVPDGINRYTDAMMRHLLDEATDGPIDKEMQVFHKVSTAWNALAALELFLKEQQNEKQESNTSTSNRFTCRGRTGS